MIYSGSAQSLCLRPLFSTAIEISTKPPSFKVLDKPLKQEHLNLTPHVARSTKCAALTLYSRGSTSVALRHKGLGRLPEMLPGTCVDARGDHAAALCPVFLFSASLFEIFASNAFVSFSYAILNP
ncbi:hypothetical protein PIB30_077758 [Stylosanthes scabra]|uniref:Uncharacterized protein n=1 Tax=Stylosanthes scabra TaxID=79078 RepID=A0ABU6QQ85_9FABA|nr:hypothetical protein [Stylosanthes scabra]